MKISSLTTKATGFCRKHSQMVKIKMKVTTVEEFFTFKLHGNFNIWRRERHSI